jgi:FkbM family methyltransferase
MVLRYQAMDILLSVSMAEGCGLPLLEAQACGLPVIFGDWSAMSENSYAGWPVEFAESVPWYVDPLECEWRLPSEEAITACLEEAYSDLQNTATRSWLASHARESMVEHHDQAHITDTQWRPVLTELAQRIEAEPVPWHVHRWNGLGTLDNDGRAITRCLVEDCPAEAEVGADGRKTILPTGAPITVGGIVLDIQDDPQGGVARHIARECEEVYRLQELVLEPGAVILDIGAHVGVVSCYLSKRFPQARIIAYEPHPDNFKRLVRNLDTNECLNVECYPMGVTDNGLPLTLHGDHRHNTGGYSAFSSGPDAIDVESVDITRIWEEYVWRNNEWIALLILDCEGAEYEILHGLDGSDLRRINHLIMEVHENAALTAEHGTAADLIAFASQYVPNVRATVMPIPEPVELNEIEGCAV